MKANVFSILMILGLIATTGCTAGSNGAESPGQPTNPDAEYTLDISKQTVGDLYLSADAEVELGSTDTTTRDVTKVITIKNSGATDLPLSINLLSSPGFVIRINRCAATLVAKSSCSLTVGFSNRNMYDNALVQTSLIVNELSAHLTSSISGSPDPDLTGTPILQVTLNAPFQPIGTSGTRIMTIKNTGTGTAKNMTVTIPSGYRVLLSRCSTNLRPQASCTMQVYNNNFRNSPNAPAGNISVGADIISAVVIDAPTGTLAGGPVVIPGADLSCSIIDGTSIPEDYTINPVPSVTADQITDGWINQQDRIIKSLASQTGTVRLKFSSPVTKVEYGYVLLSTHPQNTNFCQSAIYSNSIDVAADVSGTNLDLPISLPTADDYWLCLRLTNQINETKVCPTNPLARQFGAFSISVDPNPPRLLTAKLTGDDSVFKSDETATPPLLTEFNTFGYTLNEGVRTAFSPDDVNKVNQYKIVKDSDNSVIQDWQTISSLQIYYYGQDLHLETTEDYRMYVRVISFPSYVSTEEVLAGKFRPTPKFSGFVKTASTNGVCVSVDGTGKVKCKEAGNGTVFKGILNTSGRFLLNMDQIAYSANPDGNGGQEFCGVGTDNSVKCIRRPGANDLYNPAETIVGLPPIDHTTSSLAYTSRFGYDQGPRKFSVVSAASGISAQSQKVYSWTATNNFGAPAWIPEKITSDFTYILGLKSKANTSCALTDDGLLECWDTIYSDFFTRYYGGGSYNLGQWGNLTNSGSATPGPIKDQFGSSVGELSDFAMTDLATCVRDTEWQVKCVGAGLNFVAGEELQPHTYVQFVKRAGTAFNYEARKIWQTTNGFCGINDSGVSCWGRLDQYGPLNSAIDATLIRDQTATPIIIAGDVVYEEGFAGAVAMSSSTQTANGGQTNVPNGKIWAWTSPSNAKYIKKSDDTDLTGVVSIDKNCALTSAKDLYCWDNSFVATQVK